MVDSFGNLSAFAVLQVPAPLCPPTVGGCFQTKGGAHSLCARANVSACARVRAYLRGSSTWPFHLHCTTGLDAVAMVTTVNHSDGIALQDWTASLYG
jgi:hypothetical protein